MLVVFTTLSIARFQSPLAAENQPKKYSAAVEYFFPADFRPAEFILGGFSTGPSFLRRPNSAAAWGVLLIMWMVYGLGIQCHNNVIKRKLVVLSSDMAHVGH